MDKSLREVRETLGVNTEQMARLMGISTVPNYLRLENGRRELTNQQRQMIRTLLFINSAQLLPGLISSS